MKQGSEFESLTTHIFKILSQDNNCETVEHDIFLDGIDGPRQIDVLIKGNVGPFDIVTIVECKDRGRKVNVMQLDALHSKMQDVRAHKAVLVSRKGFTEGAKRKAKRLNISLCTAHSAQNEKWKFELRMPLLIREVCCENSKITFSFTTPLDDPVNNFITSHVSGLSIPDLIVDYWNVNDIECQDGVGVHTFHPDVSDPYLNYNNDLNKKIPITNFSIDLNLRVSYYLGSFNEIESTQFLQSIDEGKTHVIFNTGDLSNYREQFVRFDRLQDVPPAANRTTLTSKYLIKPTVNAPVAG